MFFHWLDSSEVKALAASLAGEFIQRLPPSEIKQDIRGRQRRFDEAFKVMNGRLEKFCSVKKLGIFKQARLANHLKWRLLDAGYEKSFVDTLVLDLLKGIPLFK